MDDVIIISHGEVLENMKNTNCNFSLEDLQKMKENGTIFYTAAGYKKLKIAEIDTVAGTLKMERSTGKITWSLNLEKLFEIHDKVHSGELSLNQYDIDKEMPTWGNYITGLLQYFACENEK